MRWQRRLSGSRYRSAVARRAACVVVAVAWLAPHADADWRAVAADACEYTAATGFPTTPGMEINPTWESGTALLVINGEYAITAASRCAGVRALGWTFPLETGCPDGLAAEVPHGGGWLLGTDWWLDLAVLKVAVPDRARSASIALEYRPKVGEEVFVLGHTLMPDHRFHAQIGPVTALSVPGDLARGYSYTSSGVIQLGIPFMSGMQGAPVLNQRGEVFATVCGCPPGETGTASTRARLLSALWPSVERIVDQAHAFSALDLDRWQPNAARVCRPYVGVTLRRSPAGGEPCVVATVAKDSAAAGAGILPGDAIDTVNGVNVREHGMAAAVGTLAAGARTQITWTHNGAPKTATLTLGELLPKGIRDPDTKRHWETGPPPGH